MSYGLQPNAPDMSEEEEYWLRLLSDLGSEPSVPLSMRPSPGPHSPPQLPPAQGHALAPPNGYTNEKTEELHTIYGHDAIDANISSLEGDISRFSGKYTEDNHDRGFPVNIQLRIHQPGHDNGPDSPAEFDVHTPNYPPPLPPLSASQYSLGASSEQGIAERDTWKGAPEETAPDMWAESDTYVTDQIDFIFCSKDEYDDPDQYASERLDALALCRSSLMLLQPVLRTAVDFATEKVKVTGQAIYQSAAAKFSGRLATSDALTESMHVPGGDYHSSSDRRDVAKFGPSLGSLHQTIVFLARHLDSAALSKCVRTASGTVVTLRDIALMHIARYVRSNVYLSSFVGCVHESTLFMVDRLRAGVELYSHILQGDDPEQMHLELLKDKPDWQHLLLRCSMASLTWKQRQLLEETRDGGSISSADFKRLVQAQILEFDRRRVTRISNEFFYLSPESMLAPLSPSDTADGVLVARRALGYGASPADSDASPSSLAKEHVNPDALKAILTDTASIDQLAAAAGVDVESMDEVQASQALGKLKSNIHSWLVEEATLGDEDAQYALARFFMPPAFAESKLCAICDRSFSITLFRHHCRFCGRSVCDDHSKARRCIYRYGLITPVRVCQQCTDAIDETHRMDAIIWKDLRISAYLRNKLIPYFTPAVDRSIDKVIRIADYSLTVAKNALTYNLPAKIALETVDVLKRYGLTGFTGLLLRKDFLESVELLKRISGMETMFTLSLHELTACVYYKLAIERGLRGSNPEGERLAHAPRTRQNRPHRQRKHKQHGRDDYECKDASDADVSLAVRFAALALNIIYEENPVDCQRLAKLQGWDTIFTNVESDLEPEQPCYALFATSFTDAADSRAGSGKANPEGEEDAAKGWMERRPPLPASSLSARYASAAAVLAGEDNSHSSSNESPQVRPHTDTKGSTTNKKGASSAMVKEAVLVIRGTQTIQDVVTDIRASPQMFPPPTDEIDAALRGSSSSSVQRSHADSSKTPHSNTRIPEDSPSSAGDSSKWEWQSIPSHHTYSCGGMVRSVMNVLREVGPALRRLHGEGYKIILTGHSLGGAVAALLTFILQDAIPSVTAITYGCPSCLDGATADILKGRVLSVVLHDDVISRITPQSIRMLMRELMVFREQMFQHLQQEWVDVLRRAAGLWTPRWRLAAAPAGVPQSTEKFIVAASNSGAVGNAVQGQLAKHAELDEVSIGEDGAVRSKAWDDFSSGEEAAAEENQHATGGVAPEGGAASVLVEEEQLAPLWLPGRIMHIYVSNGRCFASEVSRDFPDLRAIVLQGNIFEDHRSERIHNALLEVRAVRQSKRPAPVWQGYDASDLCACCECSFTWNSTFTGQAQEFRDKYNCRSCGRLVCDACSKQRRSIPQYGHIMPKRICDQCLYKGDFATF